MGSVLDNVLPYVHSRKQFGVPVGTFQLMQGKLADMYTDYAASRAFLYSIARTLDSGKVSGGVSGIRMDCASVILYTAERATQMALQGIQAFGGNGYINDYPLGRLLRDAKLYEIGAGTSEVPRLLIGTQLNDL